MTRALSRLRPPWFLSLLWVVLVGGTARSAEAPPVVAEIPFDFSQGVILLDVDYGGTRPAKIVLDTGDADSLLDLEVARAIGLPLELKDLKTAGSGEGAVSFYQIDPPRARLGAAEFSGAGLIVMPSASKNLLEDSGIRCEGALGYGFFKGRIVQIDYPARKLRIFTAAPDAAGGADLPIRWQPARDGSPPLLTTDQLHLGDHTVTAQIDTCFARSLVLFTTKLPWLESAPRDDVKGALYEHETLPPTRVSVPLALGEIHFQTNPAVYLAGADSAVPDTDIAAVLGNGFFQRGVLTLDFRAGRVKWKMTSEE